MEEQCEAIFRVCVFAVTRLIFGDAVASIATHQRLVELALRNLGLPGAISTELGRQWPTS